MKYDSNTKSIKDLLVLIAIVFIIAFTSMLITNRIIAKEQTSNKEIIFSNNSKIFELNNLINETQASFERYLITADDIDFLIYAQNYYELKSTIEESAPIFQTGEELILYSRIIDQMTEGINTYITEKVYNQLNNQEAFEHTRLARSFFNELTSKWNTLINYYLYSNNELWIDITRTNDNKQTLFSMLISVFFFFCLVLLVFFFIDLSKRLKDLTDASDSLSNQNWNTPDLPLSKYLEFEKVSSAFNQMKKQLSLYTKKLEDKLKTEQLLHEQTIELNREKQVSQESKIALLQAQIQPHFLFNTLNIIVRTIQANKNEDAVRLTVATSNLLRNSIESPSIVPLKDELRFLRDYIEILKERYKSRIEFSINTFECNMDLLVPAFCLQTLVENSVKHGLDSTTINGKVEINLFSDDNGGTFIVVSDNGIGKPQGFLTLSESKWVK